MTEERITSRKNPLLQQARRLLTSRKYRQEQGLFAAEGTKLLEEAVKYCPGLHTVILADGVEARIPEGVRVVRVPEDVMASLSTMETPQGALFLCRLPERTALEPRPGMLFLDGVQDPGNVGTILRTADALEVPVVLSDGCADPYSDKAVRASMGAVFRTQPQQAPQAEILRACAAQKIPLAVTAMTHDAQDIRTAALGTLATVIGSEGRGVGRAYFEAAQQRLIIPMSARCESLNAAVAATIVMWQMKR